MSNKRLKFCVKCGVQLQENQKFCPNCGTKIEKEPNRCPSCGSEVNGDARFCPDCGTPLNHEARGREQFNSIEIDKTMDASNKQEDIDKVRNIDGVNSEILSEYVGKNQQYYGKEFQRIQSGEKPKFNWAAFLAGPFLCLYRKNFSLFFKLYLLPNVLLSVGIPMFLSFQVTSLFAGNIEGLSGLMVFFPILILVEFVVAIIGGAKFNRSYYKMIHSLATNKIIEKEELKKKSGVSWKFIIIYALVEIMLALAVSRIFSAFVTYQITEALEYENTEESEWEFNGDEWQIEYEDENVGSQESNYVLESTEITEESSDNNPYIDSILLWKSYYTELTDADCVGLSKEELRFARNEIYAAYGRIFTNPVLIDYFSTKPWYYGTIPADQFDDSVFTEIQKRNLEMIQLYEELAAESAEKTVLPDWVGSYVSQDGQVLTITDIDAEGIYGTFLGYSEEGTYEEIVYAYFVDNSNLIAKEDILNMFGEKTDERQYSLDENSQVVHIQTGFGSFADGDYYKSIP